MGQICLPIARALAAALLSKSSKQKVNVLLGAPPMAKKAMDEPSVTRRLRQARRDIIKRARTEAGLSLRQMEAISDVSSNHLSELERGLRAPTTDILVQIAFSLNMTLSALVSE